MDKKKFLETLKKKNMLLITVTSFLSRSFFNSLSISSSKHSLPNVSIRLLLICSLSDTAYLNKSFHSLEEPLAANYSTCRQGIQ